MKVLELYRNEPGRRIAENVLWDKDRGSWLGKVMCILQWDDCEKQVARAARLAEKSQQESASVPRKRPQNPLALFSARKGRF
jgi:hypothetical protein